MAGLGVREAPVSYTHAHHFSLASPFAQMPFRGHVSMSLSPARSRLVSMAALVGAFGLSLLSAAPAGDWQRDATSLAWRVGNDVVWKFSFDPKNGKPFFDPLGPVGGPRLTNFKPEDHPWHYGLWFSWKYINGANYWEENRTTGKAEGLTSWKPPEIG